MSLPLSLDKVTFPGGEGLKESPEKLESERERERERGERVRERLMRRDREEARRGEAGGRERRSEARQAGLNIRELELMLPDRFDGTRRRWSGGFGLRGVMLCRLEEYDFITCSLLVVRLTLRATFYINSCFVLHQRSVST